MNRWSGLALKVVYADKGTAAHSNGFITLDKAQLQRLFAKLTPDAFANGVFFAVAHEGGHHYQFKVFGVQKMKSMKGKELEAHADYLAGVYLSLRLGKGVKIADDAKDAALQLTSGSAAYPSPYQRMVLLEKGIADGAFVWSAEKQARVAVTDSLTNALIDQDVVDSFQTAIRTMKETPQQA